MIEKNDFRSLDMVAKTKDCVPQRSVVARVGAGIVLTPCILKQLESLLL